MWKISLLYKLDRKDTLRNKVDIEKTLRDG